MTGPGAGTGGHPFRYAAFDLDGTLLEEDLTVSDRTLAGLCRLKEHGLALFVVSGRSPFLVQLLGLAPRLRELFEPVMVLRDGDILWNWRTGAVEEMHTIPAAVAPALVARGFTSLVVDTGRRLVASSARAAAAHAFYYRCPRAAIEVSPVLPPDAPAAKVTIYAAAPAVRAAMSALDGVDGCSLLAAREGQRCSVVPTGSCKTAGLTRLITRSYGEPGLAHVVAFGDGYNDACLLSCAGAGVAMPVSAPETARSATMQLTGSLASYLSQEFPRGLGDHPRAARRCPHQRDRSAAGSRPGCA